MADFIHDHGFIDWGMSHRFEVGDILFLYLTAPESRITFMLQVEQVNMDWWEKEEDRDYYLSQDSFDADQKHGEDRRYMRLLLLKELCSPALGLEDLRRHGLTGAPRSPRRLRPETAAYVVGHLEE